MTVKQASDAKALHTHTSSKEKRVLESARMVKQNQHLTVALLTAQYNADPSTSVSKHRVQWALLIMGLCSRRLTSMPLLTKHHRKLHLKGTWEH